MKELSLKKKLTIIRFYFNGLSYDRIAKKALVSKGSVSSVVSEFKAGELHHSLTVANDIETLRELSVSLEKHSLIPSQALVGISVLNMLREMNIEPLQIQHCTDLYNTLEENKVDMESLLKIASELYELYEHTGLTFTELQTKYNDLTSEVARLTPLAKQAQKQDEQISKQNRNLKELEHAITKQASKHATLNQSIAKKEIKEETLLNKIRGLEDKAVKIEERLANGTTNLNRLAVPGISPADLTSVTNMIERIASHHNIKSVTTMDKVLSELGKVDTYFDLDETIKTKRNELMDIRKTVKREKQKFQRINIKNIQLEKEQIAHKAILEEQQRYHNQQIALSNSIFNKEITHFHTEISNKISKSIKEINELKTVAHNVGIETGTFQTIRTANAIINDLVSIALGEFNGTAFNIKQANLVFLYGSHTWLSQHQNAGNVSNLLLDWTDKVIQCFKLWHPESTE